MSDPTQEGPTGPLPFADVRGHHTVDYFLRNVQQQLVALGGQADFKASVMITASSIVVSIVATNVGDDSLGIASAIVCGFVLAALLASVVTVFPKFRRHRHVTSGTAELPAGFNVVFFGHYAQISKEQFLEELSAVASDDGALYRTIAGDIYDQGIYLVDQKYRYLRVSYAAFLLGFVLGPLAYAIELVVR
jgi:Family of unknown function (DUF5706)